GGPVCVLSPDRPEKAAKSRALWERRAVYRVLGLDTLVPLRGPALFPVRLHTKLYGRVLRDCVRMYNDRLHYPEGCGGAAPLYGFLAELYPRGGRHGRARLCHGADEPGQTELDPFDESRGARAGEG